MCWQPKYTAKHFTDRVWTLGDLPTRCPLSGRVAGIANLSYGVTGPVRQRIESLPNTTANVTRRVRRVPYFSKHDPTYGANRASRCSRRSRMENSAWKNSFKTTIRNVSYCEPSCLVSRPSGIGTPMSSRTGGSAGIKTTESNCPSSNGKSRFRP